jgi:hypothetical protein
MNQRLLSLAAGLLAILPFSTPSLAGSIVFINSTLGPPIPAGVTTITELDVTFTPAASPFSDLTLTTPPSAGGSTISSTSDIVKVMISPSASAAYILLGQGFAQFQFDVPLDPATAMADIRVTSTTWITNVGNETGQTTVSFALVPEPTSLALLGIGMSGLLAFRRLFKRSVVA